MFFDWRDLQLYEMAVAIECEQDIKYGVSIIPRRMKGKWDEDSAEHDQSFIEETRKVLDAALNAIKAGEGVSVKQSLRRELEKLGWEYNRGATFRVDFPFRSKYLVFDYGFIKEGVPAVYRLKIVIGKSNVLHDKLMKWIPR